MPYKDAFELQEPVQGWSSIRSEKLGSSMLEAVRDVLPLLRAKFPFDNGGIGNGMKAPHWLIHGYENPPSEQCPNFILRK